MIRPERERRAHAEAQYRLQLLKLKVIGVLVLLLILANLAACGPREEEERWLAGVLTQHARERHEQACVNMRLTITLNTVGREHPELNWEPLPVPREEGCE